jgi:dipeptidase D
MVCLSLLLVLIVGLNGSGLSAFIPAGAAAPAAATTAAPTTAAPTPTAAGSQVPLEEAVKTMKPADVWQNFYDVTQVPRPSHHEEKIRDFLVQFGKDLNLETTVDDVGNVLIRKPAGKGMEKRKGVVLQAHMDMVAQKADGKDFDFETDPIEAYVEGGWVKADGTTLGADDGIGLALAMAILQSDTAFGPLEVLFTVNEEDGMDGAMGLQAGVLQGEILINLDSETEGVFTIGSAGGEYGTVDATYKEVAAPKDTAAYTVTVSGLQGGHSGVDINLGRGHATKLLVRVLKDAAANVGLRVAQIIGGDTSNAITRQASAVVVVPKSKVDQFQQLVKQYDQIFKAELVIADPGVTVQSASATMPAKVMDDKAQRTLINGLYSMPQNVLRMSDEVPDLVETSTNMGIMQSGAGKISVGSYDRSSVDTELDDVQQMLASVWSLAGMEMVFSGRYPGWQPNPDSPILALMQKVYKSQTGKDPSVIAIHAGLECGVVRSLYPDMDAISIGPTLQDVHTPQEKLEVATVQKLYDLLVETLKQVPE